MKRLPQKVLLVISALLFSLGALALYWWISRYNSWVLREQLQIISPLFLEIIFFLLIVAVILNLDICRRTFTTIRKASWCWLGVIVMAGLLVTMFVVPRDHRVYYDEDIYQSIGQNIAYLKGWGFNADEKYPDSIINLWKHIIGRAAMCNEGSTSHGEFRCDRLEYNKEPNGWPYILSIVFRLFGVHELASFITNNVLYAATIVTVFLIGYLLFFNVRAGLFSALIFALTPECLIWSNTTAVEPSATLFPALAVLATLLYLRNREVKSLFLLMVLAAFAVQFRPESIMIFAVIGLLIILFDYGSLKRSEFYLFAALLFILVIPHLVHLYAVKDVGWGSTGAKFSLKYLKGNLETNGLFYLKNSRFPLLFTILLGCGLIFGGSNKEEERGGFFLKEKIVLLFWIMLFLGIFLFFYAGSYNYGPDVRFSLLSAVPIALLAGKGASFLEGTVIRRFKYPQLRALVPAVIIFCFIPFLQFVRLLNQEAWGARADHRFAKKMAAVLPEDSIVLTHNPNMFFLWGKNAAQASLATEHPAYFKRFFYKYKGGIYFHYNFWCNVPDRLQNSFCTNILKRYNCTPIMSFKERNYTYALYKVEKKKKAVKAR